MTLLTIANDYHVSSLRTELVLSLIIHRIQKLDNRLSRTEKQLLEMIIMMMTTSIFDHVLMLLWIQFRFIINDFFLFFYCSSFFLL